MNYIIGLIKNRKVIIGIGAVLFIGVGAYLSWNKIEEGIYKEGYNDAVQEYQVKLQQAQSEYNSSLEQALVLQRDTLSKRHSQEVERIKEESNVDKEVQTITEYIEEKVYVKEECDVVPPNLSRMFNNSIDSINRDK